jgi:hypothetical protein
MDNINDNINPILLNLSKIGNDSLGYISLLEKDLLPFVPKRIYWTYNAPDNVIRGNHSHHELEQIIVALSGVINITIINCSGVEFEFKLDSPDKGVYIPKKCWRVLEFSNNAVLMCVASMEYLESDYVRDYKEFQKSIDTKKI